MGDLTGLALGIGDWGALVLLYGIRPLVALEVFPATANPMLGSTVRRMLAMVYAAFAATGSYLAGHRALQFELLLTLREALIGFTLGFAGGQMFWVAESMGALVDNMAGYNNVQLMNPSRSEQSTPVSDLMMQLAVTLFWGMGGMLLLFGLLNSTHAWWPLFSRLPQWPDIPLVFTQTWLAQFMQLVAAVSLPILFLIAVVDIALALVSRATKNVDTNPLGQPLKAAAAITAMVLFSSVFVQDFQTYLSLEDLSAWMAHLRSTPP
jgi:type III secretion protein T